MREAKRGKVIGREPLHSIVFLRTLVRHAALPRLHDVYGKVKRRILYPPERKGCRNRHFDADLLPKLAHERLLRRLGVFNMASG